MAELERLIAWLKQRHDDTLAELAADFLAAWKEVSPPA